MTLRSLSLALLLSAPLLPACDGGGDDEEGPNVDCATATVPKYSEMTAAWGKCVTCHSSNLTATARNGAPAGINYDTYEAARPTPRPPWTRSSRAPCPSPAAPP
jgi:hypothetical protein